MADTAPRNKPFGLHTRLHSHFSGRRSGDQLCVYVADRLVLENLTANDIENISGGRHQMDAHVRQSCPEKAAVTLEDVRWALGIARISHATILRDAARHMSGSDFESLCKEHVRKAGPDGLKHSDLLRRSGVKKAKPQDLKGAIERLIDSEQIRNIGNQDGAGRKGPRYALAG
jgi:hypothetical protein